MPRKPMETFKTAFKMKIFIGTRCLARYLNT